MGYCSIFKMVRSRAVDEENHQMLWLLVFIVGINPFKLLIDFKHKDICFVSLKYTVYLKKELRQKLNSQKDFLKKIHFVQLSITMNKRNKGH